MLQMQTPRPTVLYESLGAGEAAVEGRHVKGGLAVMTLQNSNIHYNMYT